MPSNTYLESDESILPAPVYNHSEGFFAHDCKPSSGIPSSRRFSSNGKAAGVKTRIPYKCQVSGLVTILCGVVHQYV
jgi:hypothetical protein